MELSEQALLFEEFLAVAHFKLKIEDSLIGLPRLLFAEPRDLCLQRCNFLPQDIEW